MHRPYTDAEFQCSGKSVSKQLVSNIMNLIGHYKNWAIKEHMYPTIYLIYSTSDTFNNAMTSPGYRGHFIKINDPSNSEFFFLNDAIRNGYSIIPTLVKYIKNVYAVDSKFIEPSAVPLYLSQLKPTDWNLLISRDEYDLQYAYMNKWSFISPKGDNSTFIVKGKLWDYIRIKEKIEEPFYFHPELFIWAKAILGDSYRSIPKLTRTGWKSIIKYLKEVATDSEQDSPGALELQMNKLVKFISDKKIKDFTFNDNMYCTDVSQQVKALPASSQIIIQQQLVDMEDNQSLQNLNSTIFKEYPINLLFLLRDIPPVTSAPHDKYFWKK